jgi:hypothetical protein
MGTVGSISELESKKTSSYASHTLGQLKFLGIAKAIRTRTLSPRKTTKPKLSCNFLFQRPKFRPPLLGTASSTARASIPFPTSSTGGFSISNNTYFVVACAHNGKVYPCWVREFVRSGFVCRNVHFPLRPAIKSVYLLLETTTFLQRTTC